VTEVHWRIIANLGFKFRSHFTARIGRRAAAAAVLLAGESSRAMLASAKVSFFILLTYLFYARLRFATNHIKVTFNLT